MALDERGWHRLYDRAREMLGEEEADTLMARLPPTSWTDLATKNDLEQGLDLLRHQLTATFHQELHTAIAGQTKAYLMTNTALLAALAGVFLAVR